MRKDLGTTCLKEIQDRAPTSTRVSLPLGLATIELDTLGRLVLEIRNEVEIVLS